MNGNTCTRTIRAVAVDTTRAQIAKCQRLRRLTAALMAVSKDLRHTRLRAETANAAAAEAELDCVLGPGSVDRADGEAVASASTLRLMAGLLRHRFEAGHSDDADAAVRLRAGSVLPGLPVHDPYAERRAGHLRPGPQPLRDLPEGYLPSG